MKMAFDPRLLHIIKNAEVDDVDRCFEDASEAAQDIDNALGDNYLGDPEHLKQIYFAWQDDTELFRDVLAASGVRPRTVAMLEMVCCDLLEAISELDRDDIDIFLAIDEAPDLARRASGVPPPFPPLVCRGYIVLETPSFVPPPRCNLYRSRCIYIHSHFQTL